MGSIIAYLVLGLLAGFLAKAILPGKQGGGLIMTALLGIVGSMVGGFLGGMLLGRSEDGNLLDIGSIITAVIGAIIVLIVYGMLTKKK